VLAGGWRSLALPGAEGDAYKDHLDALTRELGLERAIHVTGYLSKAEVSALLFAADVVALPFTYGLSFKSGALLAALSHVRPVVGTQPEHADPHLRQGEHFISVPPRDADSLAAAILALLEDRALQARIARAGAEAAGPFNWQTIANVHLDLYSQLLAARASLHDDV
jgi:glycosyltransferase involved in cell wall biosynthesis